MSPRSYKSPRREEAKKETLRQIVAAVVELHAEKGVLATTHADIAKRANVAIPTVYNYFPSTRSLLPACLSHVQAMAPSLDPNLFSNKQEIPARLALLVKGIFTCHSFYAPWLRWGICEAEHFPELKAFLDQARVYYLELIEKAFSPGFSGPPPQALIMIAYALMDFPAWNGFKKRATLSQEKLEDMVTDALVSLFYDYKNEEIKP